MSRTKRPCPGCGQVKPWRAASEVCADCKVLLDEGRKARERAATVPRGTELAVLPFAPHRLGYIPHFWQPFLGERHKSADAVIQQAIFDLASMFGEQVEWRDVRRSNQQPLAPVTMDGHGGNNTYWKVPIGLRDILTRLYEAVQAGAKHAYEEGKHDGHSLLIGLATGQTSIEDFNKATIGTELTRRTRRGSK
jgi:hypothetical protein